MRAIRLQNRVHESDCRQCYRVNPPQSMSTALWGAICSTPYKQSVGDHLVSPDQ
uniref:Uncharacterized protein n=1 Tax=Physcomitrium patens TaxID=3218 RepID=A0A2K1IBD6_PHYPA|nr:hypothetical protein PHYPA_030083 [Physcomitrium patens]